MTRWPALCGNRKLRYSGFVIAPPFHNIHCPGKLVFGLLFYPTDALLWKLRLYFNWSVKVSLLRPFFNIPSSEGYSNLSFLYSTRSVQLINSYWRTVSVCSAWLWNVIAKERISGSLDLPNGFQYAYTVSLYTHDSGSQVIDDSTIGGRWKTRLSESLPGGH